MTKEQTMTTTSTEPIYYLHECSGLKMAIMLEPAAGETIEVKPVVELLCVMCGPVDFSNITRDQYYEAISDDDEG